MAKASKPKIPGRGLQSLLSKTWVKGQAFMPLQNINIQGAIWILGNLIPWDRYCYRDGVLSESQ